MKKCATRLKIIKLALTKIKSTDINIKPILLQVYCRYFDIDIKSARFQEICLEVGVNVYTVYKYCKIIT